MAHELTEQDGLVLHRERAWHGLGVVVQDAPTPREALKLARLDWRVDRWPLTAFGPGGERVEVEHVAMVRADTQKVFGVAGNGYQPIQNAALADFAEALADEGDTVRLESAGSIRGGAKVWMLLKGESFSVRSDELHPYILLANGHDGATAMQAIPTTIRVVCSNTLHMALAAGRSGWFTIRHTGDVQAKVAEARAVLGLYRQALTETRAAIDRLAARDVNREDVQAFFLECYTRDFGAIPNNPKDQSETTKRERSVEAYRAYGSRFDRERSASGPTAWTMANAYTGWLQHDRRVKAPDEGARRERRIDYRIFGEDAARTIATVKAALARA